MKCAIRWIMVLSILVGAALPVVVPPAEAKHAPEHLYSAGNQCQDRLEKSSETRKYRHHWERCILDFEALLNQYPRHRLVQRSLFSLGKLYAGLHDYSGRRPDLDKALKYYRELISNYPTGSLAETARARLEKLDALIPRDPLVTVQDIRHWAYPDYIRLVLDMDRAFEYRLSPSDEKTVSITIHRARLSPDAEKGIAALKDGFFRSVALRQAASETVRLTIDLNDLVKPPKVVPLSNPDRLVIDLFSRSRPEGAQAPTVSENPLPKSSEDPPAIAMAVPLDVRTIVIDPGHGGKDPGAVGRTGLTEKEIVLDIGLRLRRLIRERTGKTVMMTREDDTFIALDDRTLFANSKNADLFVSIHVNSHPKRSTRGVEVYHLGQSSDSGALAVAARENNVSLESLGALEKSVKQILFDLGREFNINQSQELAYLTRQSFQDTMEKRYEYTVVDHGVKRAPFYVLLNSNMPSILAEVSFISNPDEERLLQKSQYRQAIAESLFEGIRTYLAALKPVS